MRAAGRRAATRASTRWARALRRLLLPFDGTDRRVHRHPSRHRVEGARRVAGGPDAPATVTPIAAEHRFEDLLEEWGRSA